MKIIIVHIGDIFRYPPIINLINIIEDLAIECIVLTTRSEFNKNENFKYVKFYELDIDYEKNSNLIIKLKYLIYIRRQLWKIISQIYTNDSLIWVSSNVALKYLGNRINKTNYILHLMELFVELKYHYKIPFFKLNVNKIGNSALAVVVPEYNRAHITKVWWKLKYTPLIFHNKPYFNTTIKAKAYITNLDANNIINSLKNKKIILYQGIIDDKERPLINFIKAIDKLGTDYAFVVMSNGENIYKNIKSKNYYFIPYVKPPKHLEITSHAYIGVLSYYPVKSFSSELNSLYCAPNKTFEYSMFGIPMIGNDVPGLKYVLEPYNAGICIDELSINNICAAIKQIELNYESMSCGATQYYNSVDLKSEFLNILNIVTERMKNNAYLE